MIYALVHPDTLEVRYVGKTRDGAARTKQHRANVRKGHNLPVYRWWRKVVEQAGHEPCLVRLGEGDSAEEIAMIAKLRTDGARLLNCTDGGENSNPNEETRAKTSASLRGRKLTSEHRARIGESLRGNSNTKGKPLSEEHRAKVAAFLRANPPCYWRGKKFSAEHRAKLSQSKVGNKNNPAIGGWNRGKKASSETRAKLREAQRARRAREAAAKS